MSAPTGAVRAATYKRDEYRCASCGSTGPLQYQHRAAEGMGGRVAAPLLEEGLTACWSCNPWYEHAGQQAALKHGWKVRRWVVEQGKAHLVPVFFQWERRWCELTPAGARVAILRPRAMELMREVYGPAWDDEKGLAA